MSWDGLTPPYATIVADPPWPVGRRYARNGPDYSLMTLDQIAKLPVGDLAAEAAHLYLWVPAKLNRHGIGVQIANAWGFPEDVSEFVWAKANLGMGHFPRLSHEIVLMFRRGALPYTGALNVHSVQGWKQPMRGQFKQHSAKPPSLLDLIVTASPAPRVELFARQQMLGWDSWGWGHEGAVS